MIFDNDRRLVRGTYIGGHDVVALLNLHPFMTSGDVYAHMVLGHREDIGNKPSVRRGRIIEPGLLDEIETTKGLSLRRGAFVLDDEAPYLGGTVDAIDEGRRILVEVTTTSSRNRAAWGVPGTDDAATYKWMQAQFYLGLLGYEEALVVCFVVDTDELLEYPIRRNQQAIDEMREGAERFFLDHIGTRTPPNALSMLAGGDVDGAAAILEVLYAKDNGSAVEPTPELIDAAGAYVAARETETEAAKAKEQAATTIKAHLADASTSKWEGGRVQWSSSNLKPSVDYEETTKLLAKRLQLSDGELAEFLAGQLKARKSSRALRVFLTKQKDGGQ